MHHSFVMYECMKLYTVFEVLHEEERKAKKHWYLVVRRWDRWSSASWRGTSWNRRTEIYHKKSTRVLIPFYRWGFSSKMCENQKNVWITHVTNQVCAMVDHWVSCWLSVLYLWGYEDVHLRLSSWCICRQSSWQPLSGPCQQRWSIPKTFHLTQSSCHTLETKAGKDDRQLTGRSTRPDLLVTLTHLFLARRNSS